MPAPALSVRPGYIGSVVFDGTLPMRARSSSIGIRQSIQMPDVVDGRIDRTLYQLGAIEVGGSVTVPVVQDANSNRFLETLWDYCVERDRLSGELLRSDFVIAVNYSYDIGRQFNGCRVNMLSMRMSAGEAAEATVDVMGTTVSPSQGSRGDLGTDTSTTISSPAKVVTWNDISITDTSGTFGTCEVREFSFEINNNCNRNYTFCPEDGLFASSINTGKRFVNGTIGFQGFARTDAAFAFQNSTNCSNYPRIRMAIDGCGGDTFQRFFNNIVYEFQQIDIQSGANALITSTVNWYAFGGNLPASSNTSEAISET